MTSDAYIRIIMWEKQKIGLRKIEFASNDINLSLQKSI